MAASAHSPTTKWALALFDVSIILVKKKSQILSLPSTVLHVMAIAKVEHVVAENASELGVELSSAGTNVYQKLRRQLLVW